MTRFISQLLAGSARSAVVKIGLSAAALGVVPTAAMADWHDRDDRGRVGVDVDFGRQRPAYVDRQQQVWVEPVYRTVCDRVWVAPVTQSVSDRVWVPDRYETRDVVSYRHGWRRVTQEQVLVDPGHYVDQCHDVVITPGHYEDVQRQELVSGGHWETRVDRVEVVRPHDGPRIDVRLPFHW